jgi:hypothetical protein
MIHFRRSDKRVQLGVLLLALGLLFVGCRAHPTEVIFAEDHFVAVTGSMMLRSPDGMAWKRQTQAPPGLLSLAVDNDQLVAVSANQIYRSGSLPPWIELGAKTGFDEIRLVTHSDPGVICNLYSTADFGEWTWRGTLTNALGYGWLILPASAAAAYFRVSVEPEAL